LPQIRAQHVAQPVTQQVDAEHQDEQRNARSQQPMKTKKPRSLRRIAAGLCGFMTLAALSLPAQNTGPQQLVFTGLLGSTNPNPNAQFNAQFNAVQSDASGNLYLLLDQKDGDALKQWLDSAAAKRENWMQQKLAELNPD